MNEIDMTGPVTALGGIGPKTAAALARLEIRTVMDLVGHYPQRFDFYPEPEDGPRLVYGFTLTCAALLEEGASPLPGPCRLSVDGVEDEITADLRSVTADAMGRRMLLLRLTEFPEELYEMRVVFGEIAS